MLITFEGLDFSGKSTQIQLLVDRLKRERVDVLLVREPGGTSIGERIRSLLLDRNVAGMSIVGELFLFSASRVQLVEEVIKPALAKGTIVICDRFYDSTTAYQGWGRGIPLEAVRAINKTATGGLVPDVTVFLDMPPGTIEERISKRKLKDRMESNDRAFYERVRNGYLALAKEEKRFFVVDGTQSVEQLHEQIWARVATLTKQSFHKE